MWDQLFPESPLDDRFTWMFYTFEGRKANQTLGMLVTKRMEKMGFKPLSFSITDYGLSVRSIHEVPENLVYRLVHPDILGDEL